MACERTGWPSTGRRAGQSGDRRARPDAPRPGVCGREKPFLEGGRETRPARGSPAVRWGVWLAVWSGSECLWTGAAPDAVMGVRPGDQIDLPGVEDTPALTVVRRHVSLAADRRGALRLTLRLEVEVG